MHKYLHVLNYCRIFASEKETNNKLNPKTRKGTEIMTTRQRNLEVTTYGIEQVKNGNIIADIESFKAWMATVKKGQYIGRDICRKMYNEIGKVLGFEVSFDNEDFWRFQSFCKGLAINYPQYFSYTDTLGLDNLTIK